MPPLKMSRRRLFGALAGGCASLPALAFSAPVAAAGVPKTGLGPGEALARLKEGNAVFVKGGACVPAGGERIAPLAAGQAPFAAIVGCSDSRTPPELVFNTGLGELFIVRVAGNTVDRAGRGSLEYAVVVLGVPLVVVLGHSGCGAVEAAVKIVTEKASYPGAIGDMVQPIVPAVRKARTAGGDLVAGSVRGNVVDTVDQLKRSEKTLSDPFRAGKLQIVGGIYDLATGAVAFIA
ncbi:MAG: carbonic anhydrase [Bradyrhizobiaceae bacterium]|nr:carbonic anhydrase [Bradyrhizobiaceae bacterium]